MLLQYQTVYNYQRYSSGTETSHGTVGLQVKGAGSTDTLTHRPPTINPPEWVCPVLCHLTSRYIFFYWAVALIILYFDLKLFFFES